MRRRLGIVVAVLMAGIAASMAPADAVPITTRIDGEDRYATAVELSFAFFPTPPVPVVYVASGETFPDALSGGAAAADDGGPVLLTERDTLPQVTKDELNRLQATKVYVVGGTEAVSNAVKDALDPYSVQPVGRIQGANRFETSAAISLSSFPVGVPIAYVAAGHTFADALPGSAAAGTLNGPVLLVEKGSVPATVGTELDRLNPGKIVILGGTDVILASVQTALGAWSATVERVAGADRYATAAQLSAGVFSPGLPLVFVVTGENFPDGLAAGAVAGGRNAPVLLTHGVCMPKVTSDELTRLNPGQVFLVGGPTAIATGPDNQQLPCPENVPGLPSTG